METSIEICNKLGLHARAAAKLVTVASNYRSEIKLSKGAKCVNAKSIMSVLMLAAGKGAVLKIITEGKDAEEATTAIVNLINDKFEEE